MLFRNRFEFDFIEYGHNSLATVNISNSKIFLSLPRDDVYTFAITIHHTEISSFF